MNLTIKYSIINSPNTAQMPADASAQGNAGVNFIGASVDLAMAMANPTSGNNTHQGSILPSTKNISSGTYVDKIVSILLPTLAGTTFNYLSVTLDKIGINSDIVGVEILGTNRDEQAAVAAFAKNVLLDANIGSSVSKNRLILSIAAVLNALTSSTLNLRITYKN